MGKIIALLMLPLALLAIIRFSGGGRAVAHGPAVTPPAPRAEGSVAGLAPDFSLAKLGGGTISLADYRGKKPVIVDFWASWCPNCRRDMPKLSRWYEQYRDRVEVIGINLQEGEGAVERFVSNRGVTFPIALDPDAAAANAYAIRYTNTHILVDKNGRVQRIVPGDISESDILSLIET